MRFLYDLAFLVFALFYAPFFWQRIKRTPNPSRVFQERLGNLKQRFSSQDATPKRIWIHAVSVGETLAIVPLVKALAEELPDYECLISTVTPTGQRIAQDHFGEERVFYFPFDLQFCVQRALKAIQPSMILIAETELWPNFLTATKARNIPVALVNARLSEKSFKSYKRLKPIFSRLFDSLSLCLAQAEEDGQRFLDLGLVKDRMRVTGNLKYDAAPLKTEEVSVKKKEIYFSKGARVLIAGSTHPGEERALLRIYDKLVQEFPALVLVLAPRHPNRASEIVKEIDGKYSFQYLSSQKNDEEHPQVWILDSLGKLKNWYQWADVVFLGGSLIPHGGHNPIEPALFGKSVITGPHVHNFKQIFADFLFHQASFEAKDEEALFLKIQELLRNPEKAHDAGLRAKNLVNLSRGATDRTIFRLLDLLQEGESINPLIKPICWARIQGKAGWTLQFLKWIDPKQDASLFAKLMRATLFFLSGFYYLGLLADKFKKTMVGTPIKLSVPVLCVGNLTWGGTGKTPFVLSLIDELTTLGYELVLLSRGFGGDEEVLFSSRYPKVKHITGRDRALQAKEYLEKKKVDLALCDDAFQHWQLQRDWDIVLLDGEKPFANGRLIPAGPLREPIQGLKRAQSIILTRSDSLTEDVRQETMKRIQVYAPEANITEAVHRAVDLICLPSLAIKPVSFLHGLKLCVVCGIANPKAFVKTLQERGARVESVYAFPDHYKLDEKERKHYAELIQSKNLQVITTEKDLSRMPEYFNRLGAMVLRIDMEWNGFEDELTRIIQGLGLAEREKRGTSNA